MTERMDSQSLQPEDRVLVGRQFVLYSRGVKHRERHDRYVFSK